MKFTSLALFILIGSASSVTGSTDYMAQHHRMMQFATHFDGAKDPTSFPLGSVKGHLASSFKADFGQLDQSAAAEVREAFRDWNAEQISYAAMAPFLNELCSRLDGNDSATVELAGLFDAATQAERDAFSSTFDDIVSGLSVNAQAAVSQLVSQRVANSKANKVNYAAAAVEVPEMVRVALTQVCTNWKSVVKGEPIVEVKPPITTPTTRTSGTGLGDITPRTEDQQ